MSASDKFAYIYLYVIFIVDACKWIVLVSPRQKMTIPMLQVCLHWLLLAHFGLVLVISATHVITLKLSSDKSGDTPRLLGIIHRDGKDPIIQAI